MEDKPSSTNRPKRKARLEIPNPQLPNRIVKLSVSNLLFIAVAIIAVILLVSSYLQPKSGEQVSIDQFLNNIKANNYSQVEIRNDGNAVATGKYLEVANIDQSSLKANASTKIVTSDKFDKKNISDLVTLFKTPTNFADVIKHALNSLDSSKVKELLVLDDKVIVDWANTTKPSWLIENTKENDLIAAFTTNNIDIASLQVPVNYLRIAGTTISGDQLTSSLQNNRYASIWAFADKTYGRVADNNIALNYVNYGTATPDFTKFIQNEGINLSSRIVEFKVMPINQLDLGVILNIVMLGGLIFLGYMLLRSVNGSNGGLMKFGQSKARMFMGQKIDIKFKDVAGVDEAKEELKEIVDFLKNPAKYTKLGAKIPRGVLMVGEPGTGKTLLARAVAGEAGVPFFHTSGSEFEEMLVGAGASRVRDLFQKAKKASPALIFIDEIDAVGRKRGTTIQSSSTEQTLNQILVEMDGFEPRDNVIVIAATNRPDVLDPALLRPGRFDRKVILDAPDIEGRKAILEIHAANKPLAADVDLLQVSKRTVGFSGADLANMLNEAAIIVAKSGRKEITSHDIEEAATKVQAGPIRKRSRSKEELKMTAYHEAAHAVVMKITPQSDPVHRITILSRGMALGYTMPLPETDQLQMTKTKMLSRIKALLAGFISEEMVFKDVTTGASNDIEKATSLAQKMVKQFGMSKKLGLVKYGSSDDQPQWGWEGGNESKYSDATAQIIDEEVRKIIQDCYESAKTILVEYRSILDILAQLLIDKEVIEGDEFKNLFSKV